MVNGISSTLAENYYVMKGLIIAMTSLRALPWLDYLINGISSTLTENYCGKVMNGLTGVTISIMALPKLN